MELFRPLRRLHWVTPTPNKISHVNKPGEFMKNFVFLLNMILTAAAGAVVVGSEDNAKWHKKVRITIVKAAGGVGIRKYNLQELFLRLWILLNCSRISTGFARSISKCTYRIIKHCL